MRCDQCWAEVIDPSTDRADRHEFDGDYYCTMCDARPVCGRWVGYSPITRGFAGPFVCFECLATD